MKTSTLKLVSSMAALSAALTFSSEAFAYADTSGHAAVASNDLRVASKQDLKWSADKIAGEKIVGRDGKDLGTIKDVLIDAKSGRVAYAVVSVGGFAGMGDKLHLVPFTILNRANNDKHFTATLTADDLTHAPVLQEEPFEENRVTVGQQVHQQIADAFRSSANVIPDFNPDATLIRATKLKGRDVMANGGKIGEIDNVVVESGATHALAAFKPDHKVARDHGTYLIPLDRLHIEPGKKGEITTTLTSADFETAANTTARNDNDRASNRWSDQNRDTVADQHYATTTPGLTPTGHTSAEQTPDADRDMISAAHQIRQALDRDPSLARADVRVTPEHNRVTVRGTVDSTEQKAAVEHAADTAAHSASIDFDLKVK